MVYECRAYHDGGLKCTVSRCEGNDRNLDTVFFIYLIAQMPGGGAQGIQTININ